MDAFKIPDSIPQDLLLIHDIVGPLNSLTSNNGPKKVQADDCIDSSDSENDSEDEIEADLIVQPEEGELNESKPRLSDSSSELDSESDSDSDSDVNSEPLGKQRHVHDIDDDEDFGPVATTGTYFQTKNEIVETDVAVPDIEEVEPDEVLEKVGQIMAIIDKLAIIKGVPSEFIDRGSERALDSDTLLVFEDRKVMGYIYETFGPTSQPLYQVKFNSRYPLDPEKVWMDREVFHVPQRSNFVFLSRIKNTKGSDASNVYDEEPADDELEFSDDEAEAAYKSSMKRKRGDSRASSGAHSRHGTPSPSQMRDQDLTEFLFPHGGNPYEEHGPYDVDFTASSSRPAPIPYDDPYSNEYSLDNASTSDHTIDSGKMRSNHAGLQNQEERGKGRGRARARGQIHGRDSGMGNGRPMGGHGRGRARGRGRGNRGAWSRRDDNSCGNSEGSHPHRTDGWDGGWTESSNVRETTSYNPQSPRPLSPTSLAIAHATGQHPSGLQHTAGNGVAVPSAISTVPSGWPYQQTVNFGTSGYQQPYVQPHINPRFASAFGMQMSFTPPQAFTEYTDCTSGGPRYPHGNSNWADEYTIHTSTGDETGG